MTTVSSSTSSASSTAATSTSQSITQTLGAGSGIDIKSLVTNLVNAQFSVKNQQLSAQSDKLTAQVSSVAKLSQGITGFRDALKALVQGGTLSTQPSSSNAAVATVALQKGGSAVGLSAQLNVQQIASNQAATSNAPIGTTQAFKGGTLTVKIGSYVTANGTTSLSPSQTVPITIADGATIDQIAAQITSATGLKTALIKDNGGVRLSIKGATGAAQAFEISSADGNASTAANQSLSILAVGSGATGMTVGSTAKDAMLTLDGASFTRSTNTISDLLPGVDLNLVGVSTSPVTLGSTPPGSALTAAVQDVVDTFNALQSIINTERDATTGALRSDSAAAALNRMLSGLTLTPLTSTPGGPKTLAELGIGTDTDKRDGSLKLDTAKLASVMAKNPAGVEAIFATDSSGNGGLFTAISAIATKATDKTSGLAASTASYQAKIKQITDQQSQVTDDIATTTTRMTQQYAAMDARVAAYKASQSFIEQQVKVWTKSN